jgi:hypothetical protein
MNFILSLLFFLSSFTSSLADVQNPCLNAIQKHVEDAIVHNKKNAPIYSRLSNGDSTFLSWTLIATEEISIYLLKGMEKRARPYQEKGIPLLCEEVVDMKLLPTFQDNLQINLRPTTFLTYDQSIIRNKISGFTDKDQFNEAYQAIKSDLMMLEKYPHQLCMTRHILESIARTLLLAPKHQASARAQNLADPKEIIKEFITIQNRSLPLAYYLDKWAFPLQKKGLMIYCQDVPPIPWK